MMCRFMSFVQDDTLAFAFVGSIWFLVILFFILVFTDVLVDRDCLGFSLLGVIGISALTYLTFTLIGVGEHYDEDATVSIPSWIGVLIKLVAVRWA